MNPYTLDEVQNELIGKPGTPAREKFEYELQMDMIELTIKQISKKEVAKRNNRAIVAKAY
jgi:HTH-type transcriptional regulator / antitoxin HipB